MSDRLYAQARADFEYLESLAEMDDFVEVDARVMELMRSPTKSTALKLYITAIDRWFTEALLTGRELTARAAAIQSTWCRTNDTSTASGGQDNG